MVGATGMSLEPLLDATSVGILAVDARGMVFFMNKAAEKFLRTTRPEVLDHEVEKVLPGVGKKLIACLAAGKPLRGEKVHTDLASLIFNVDPIASGDKTLGAVATLAEATLETSILPSIPSYDMMKNWLDAIIDSSYDGLWICDHEGTVLRINKASERMSGIRAEDVVGKNMRELVSSGLYDKSVTFEVLRKKTSVTMVQQIRGKKKVLITGNPVFDEQGEIRFVVTNSRDLTEFESLKHQLEETQALAQSYRSRLSELEMRDVDLSSIVYRSEAMQRVLELAIRVAKVDSTVLLLGESGVGKGLIAKLIHKHSGRGHGPFVRVDCAGIPDTLIESELFGYEKGAFTGARAEGKPGFFELADKGTLFLDEIAELPVGSQSKLLRFLEDHELFRVGGTTPRTIDARVIAATNRNIEQMVSTHLFREDLYYRLNVVPLPIPPLRSRPEDILPLLLHFLKLFNERYHRGKTLSTAALDAICAYPFPGNVRELSNLVERLVVATEDDLIDHDHLPDIYRQPTLEGLPFPELSEAPSLKEALKRYEAFLIEKVVKNCGSRRKAAKILKVNHTTITRKLNRCRSA